MRNGFSDITELPGVRAEKAGGAHSMDPAEDKGRTGPGCREGRRSHSREPGVTEEDRQGLCPAWGWRALCAGLSRRTKGHGTSLPRQKHGLQADDIQGAANHLWTSPGRQ